VKRYIFIFGVLACINLQAQKLSLGIEGGGNVTALLTSSKYSNQGPSKLAPWFGYYLGVNGKYKLSDKGALKFFIQGEKRNVKNDGVLLTDPSGYPLNDINLIVSNTYLNVGALYLFSLSQTVELGVGVNNHILVSSTSYSSSLKKLTYPSNSRFKNEYFKTYLVSVPVQLIINIDRYAICPSLDFGLMNRIGNSGGVYKQFEYVAQLGVSYKLKK
jgi:hypothetical protein